MSVVSSRLPRKSNLVIAHAAAMPKRALAGTVSAATRTVSQIADSASGDCDRPDVSAPAVPQRLDEDERKGDEKKDDEKGERDRRQARRAPSSGSVNPADGAGSPMWLPRQYPSRLVLQPCSALSTNSSTNDRTSSTNATAAAPV